MNIIRVEQKKLCWSKWNETIKRFFDLLVISTVFTSIVGASIITFSFLIFSDNILFDMVICTALITYSIYSINRLTDIEEDSSNIPERISYINKKKGFLMALAIISYITAIFIGGMKNLFTIPIFLIPLFIGIFYSIKLADFRIKDIFGIKNFAVSFSWALSSSLLPFIFFNKFEVMIMFFLFMFIKCFVNTVVFDIRDIEGDKKAGAKTIPIVIGVEKTFKTLIFIHSLLWIWLIACILNELFLKYIPIFLFSIFYGYFYIIKFCKHKSKRIYFDYLVDGEFILLAIFGITLNII